MTSSDWMQICLFFVALIFLTPIFGRWMALAFDDQRADSRFEKAIYKVLGIKSERQMDWKTYAFAVVSFNVLGILLMFGLQLAQAMLPLNPQKLPNVPWALALNTAVSFVTNTNWQAYSGETTLSYFTQMMGCTVQNFVSAACGIAVLLVLIRGLTRASTDLLGNFWKDLVRAILCVLLPISILLSLVFVEQGVIQNFKPAVVAKTLEGSEQTIAQGPAASQISIKALGTNGGGFFNANSAHPYENPTPLTNFLSMLALILLPAALTYTFGIFVGNRRQGWVIFAAMLTLLIISLSIGLASEYGFSGTLEGKETRFGVTNSILYSTLTTAASNGSINSALSSLTPLAGGMAMLNIMLGEIVFGGIGSGLYGMLLFVILTVFLCGLMVGRTPEYLGKKIEAREIQWAMLGILAPSAVILVGSGISAVLPLATSSLSSRGPHGLSELLYAFTSAAGNNGSAFAGLNANTNFFNLTLAFAMIVGRFAVIVPVLAIAGGMAKKKITPQSSGTFATDSVLFGVLLIGVVLIVGALTFFPALSLGPIVEQILMMQGKHF